MGEDHPESEVPWGPRGGALGFQVPWGPRRWVPWAFLVLCFRKIIEGGHRQCQCVCMPLCISCVTCVQWTLWLKVHQRCLLDIGPMASSSWLALGSAEKPACRDYGPEEKAKRAELRRQETEARRKAKYTIESCQPCRKSYYTAFPSKSVLETDIAEDSAGKPVEEATEGVVGKPVWWRSSTSQLVTNNYK